MSQSPVFYHLSTAEGLSDNNVNNACIDRNGILWIGTTEGLNSFDGNRINRFQTYDYPEMTSNNIDDIITDQHNNLWLKTATPQLTMLDENRNFHLFTIGDSSNKKNITDLFATSRGMIAIKANQQYICTNPASGVFTKLDFPFQDILPTLDFISPFTADKIIFYGDNRLLMIDYKTMQLLMDIPIKNIIGVAPINTHELLAYTLEGDLMYKISVDQKKISTTYHNLLDQHQQPMEGNLRNVARIDSNRFCFTSRFSGLYFLDLKNERLEHITHDALDQRSIGGNNTYRIRYDSSGYLLVTTQTSGLHYYNVKQQQAASKSYFINDRSEIFDGYIQTIATSNDSIVWLGTQDRLVRWNRKTDETSYIPCYLPNGKNISKEETIRVLEVDEKGNLWVGTTRFGILVLDKQLKTIAHITQDTASTKPSLRSGWINAICNDINGNRWVATIWGISVVDKNNYQVSNLIKHPVLSPVSNINCIELWVDSKKRIWIGTRVGVFCYDQHNNSLKHYTTKDGLANNIVHAIMEDNYGTIYFGTSGGFSVLSEDGDIRSYNRSSGLKNDRCEGLLKDENGFIWIGNLNCILRYDPVNKTFAVFEEGYGFSHAGFRMRSSFKSKAGEMFWGSDKGITWFYPDQMKNIAKQLTPSINTLVEGNNSYRFTNKRQIDFPYNTSTLVLQFASGEITGAKKIQYLYKLSGLDADWKTPTGSGQVTFNNLPPGNYLFQIKASRDGVNWFDGRYPVAIRIEKPWWKQSWFRAVYILAGLIALYMLYVSIKKRRQVKKEQQLISYFTNTNYETSSVEDILRDISRNIILLPGFENCTVFLVENDGETLVQKAAYDAKNSKNPYHTSPIVIPVGYGNTSKTAESGKACLIKESTDPSQLNQSGVYAPVINDGKVIGIIQSESRQKNFFSVAQLATLQTITSICSGKIVHALAMEVMHKSQLEVMELNVKIAESKFMNLRLQMNPHFLFNSLSSIQVLIVSQKTTEAYKYLTLFSNFLRSLLNYADKNFMPLDEELKILKMYIELESLRFDKTFSFDINVDETLSNDEVLVPSLMVQPFVENAIWHGLLHKEGEKKLSVQFLNHMDEYLTCSIEDNGIGRIESAIIQKNKIKSIVHQSKGIAIIQERLNLLQQKTGKPAHVEVIDLYNQQSGAAGTKVIITIPYYNPEES